MEVALPVVKGELPRSVECDEPVEVAWIAPGRPHVMTILGQLIGSEWLYSEPATVATIGHENGVIVGPFVHREDVSARSPLGSKEWCNVPPRRLDTGERAQWP